LQVFLDTGAFLALADEDDDYHSVAKSVHAQLLVTHAQLLTSNLVLAETYTLIRFKVSHNVAVEFMKRFDQTGIKVLRVTEAIEHTAKAIFMRYATLAFEMSDRG
jgi:predicted nucleic acid-binding protein